ncbi:MAG: hypothetical protein H7836_08410 [Magnetococcus sp. YQC-3]
MNGEHHPAAPRRHMLEVVWREVVGEKREGRERSPASLERRSPSRSKRGGTLLSCGRRTGAYFVGLLRNLRLEERVTLSLCSTEDPASIVEHGLQVCRTQGPFQRLYAVVCLDGGEGQRSHALAAPDLRSVGYSFEFKLISSIPSFALWLLLHWMDLPEESWRSAEHLSAWLDEQLARHLSAAVREDADLLFAAIGQSTAQAVVRGQRLARMRGRAATRMPVTDVHELVSYLLKLHNTSLRLRSQ